MSHGVKAELLLMIQKPIYFGKSSQMFILTHKKMEQRQITHLPMTSW